MKKCKIFLTSTVFREISQNTKISPEIQQKIRKLWDEVTQIAEVIEYPGRFPAPEEIEKNVLEKHIDLIGCHLSHPLSKDLLERSQVFAVCTSTAGFNHIGTVDDDSILITHTPGVLHETVADFTIAMVMSNLRNLVNHHDFVWSGEWTPEERWDLDQKLVQTLDNLTLGIVGMGEIGMEVIRRVSPWGVKIVYFDPVRKSEFEKGFSNVSYFDNIDKVFENADVLSLHLPLNPKTKGIVNRELLLKLKDNAVLVNTARGPVINFEHLLEILEKREKQIHIAFDVYDPEPISPEILARFHKIKDQNPDLRVVFVPHNASANADTRGKMAIMLFEDLIRLTRASSFKELQGCRFIPRHRDLIEAGKTGHYRISHIFSDE